jgi:hypothetical protein
MEDFEKAAQVESKEPDQEIEKLQLHVVSLEELEAMSFEEMKELFDENDRILFAYLESRSIPYFGLHGAAKPGLEYHQNFAKEGVLGFDTTTFYDKNVNKRTLLNSLYVCAKTAIGYAFTYQSLRNNHGPSFGDLVPKENLYQGGIEVVNLETDYDESVNYAVITDKTGYEPPNPFPVPPGRVVAKRGVIFLEPDNFKRIVKVLSDSDLAGYPRIFSKYSAAFSEDSKNHGTENNVFLHGKTLYLEALLSQKVIAESLKALGV